MIKKLLSGIIIISNIYNVNAMETLPQEIEQNNVDDFSYFVQNVVNKYDNNSIIMLPKEGTSAIFAKYNCIQYSGNCITNTTIADVNCKTLYDVIILNIVEDKISNIFTKYLVNQPIQLIEFVPDQITDSLKKTLKNAKFIKYYNNIIDDIKFIDNKLIVFPVEK